MKKLLIPAVPALGLALYFGGAFGSRASLEVFHRENVLGTSMEMKVLATSPQQALKAETAALGEIERQAKILSSWNSDSEFSRWFRTSGEAVRVSPELFEVLGLFDQWRERTGGALDASAETVGRIWKSAAKEQRLPTKAEMDAAVAALRVPHWRLDRAAGTATHLSAAPLGLNTFVKSYIMDHAADAALAASGARAVVVNIGGDIVARGEWSEPVQVVDPRDGSDNAPAGARLALRNRALATSGNYRRGYDIAGRHYSHIVDPRTGRTAEQVISATVAAANPADAGALATAMCVLSPGESRRLAESVPGAEFMLVLKDGGRVESAGWRALEAPGNSSFAPEVHAATGDWNPAFELTVNFELARITSGMYRRPFVAVWIEDKDKFPVRTLALWYDRARWLPDMRAWYRGERLRSLAEGNDITTSVASATRDPGKYNVKWDGKDNAGKLLKAGKYMVLIEASREHGTYQLIKHEMDFSGVAQKVEVPGNVEIASASLEYSRTGR